jgi:hypothetical protein
MATSYANLYVNTDAADGAGTSAGDARSTLANALGMLDANTTACVIHCKGATADTSTVTIAAALMASPNILTVQADSADRHKGVYSSSYYRIERSNWSAISILYNYVRIYGLQLSVTSTSAGDNAVDIGTLTGTNRIDVAYCIIKGITTGSTSFNVGIAAAESNTVLYAYNNIVYNWDSTLGSAIYSGGTGYIYNNTCYGSNYGIRSITASATTVKNNLCYNNTTDFGDDVAYNAASTNNLSKDTTAPALNTYYISKTITFASAGTDFHLAAGDSDAIDKGASDPGSGLFSDDIDGVTRSGTWDIGADEYVAAIGYSRGPYSSLPAADADLSTAYSAGDVTKVGTDDTDYVDQAATQQYMIHEFKDDVGTASSATITCIARTSLLPSSSIVKLQIYNRTTTTWVDVDTDDASPINTDFTLSGVVDVSANYKDGSNIICCRVWQDAI